MIQVSIPAGLSDVFAIFDVQSLIRYGGLLIVCLVVYGSTGLFFCFFLPSGAVLFSVGVLVATGAFNNDIFGVCSLLIAASILGNFTGYWFGWRAGPSLYRRKDSRFFRHQYLVTTEEFYKKYGGFALMAGFFLPIIRTFSPIVAGIIRIKFRRFILPIFAGSVFWILSFVLTGYFIGSRPLLKPWLKYMIIAFILIITLPLILSIVRRLGKLSKPAGKKDKDRNDPGL